MSDIDILAETLDQWVVSSSVSVTETNARLVVNQLGGVQALELIALIERVGWAGLEISDRGGEIPRDLLTAPAAGVRVAVDKPAAPADIELVLTNTAFAAALGREVIPARFWVRRLSHVISTIGVRFSPWDDETVDPPADRLPETRKVVRFLHPIAAAKRDLSRWVLRDPESLPTNENSAFRVWRDQAVHAVAAALANEVDADSVLIFRGPPVSRFHAAQAVAVGLTPFVDLQRAIAWAYDSPRELENRQGLLAAEVARNALRDGTLADLADVVGHALDGARIAYGFGVTQQSKDTLKALSDLRKAVTEEASKLGETTRALATAVSGAVFGAIGLVVTRLTLAPNNKFVPAAAVLVGLVLAAYVGAVIASGMHYLDLQRRLRTEWRPRLYSFLTQAEYDKLVTDPVARAEGGYVAAAWSGGIMSGLLILAAIVIVLTPLPIAAPTPNSALAPPITVPAPVRPIEDGKQPSQADKIAGDKTVTSKTGRGASDIGQVAERSAMTEIKGDRK